MLAGLYVSKRASLHGARVINDEVVGEPMDVEMRMHNVYETAGYVCSRA